MNETISVQSLWVAQSVNLTSERVDEISDRIKSDLVQAGYISGEDEAIEINWYPLANGSIQAIVKDESTLSSDRYQVINLQLV